MLAILAVRQWRWEARVQGHPLVLSKFKVSWRRLPKSNPSHPSSPLMTRKGSYQLCATSWLAVPKFEISANVSSTCSPPSAPVEGCLFLLFAHFLLHTENASAVFVLFPSFSSEQSVQFEEPAASTMCSKNRV